MLSFRSSPGGLQRGWTQPRPDRRDRRTVVTDDDLALVAEGPDLVIATPAEALEHPWTTLSSQMRLRSGLLDAIAGSSVTLAQPAAEQTLSFVRQYVTEAHEVPCAAIPSVPGATCWPPTCPRWRTTSTIAAWTFPP